MRRSPPDRALLDRLGVADRLAVVLLPFPVDQLLTLGHEQPVARETLARTAGQIAPSILARADAPVLPPLSNAGGTDPDRERTADPVPVAAPMPRCPMRPRPRRRGRSAAWRVSSRPFERCPAARWSPSSAGLAASSLAQVSDMSAAAIAARTTVHVFTMPPPRDDAGMSLQVAPLEALARSTGGVLVSTGRNPERVINRTVTELAACFVVELEPAVTDADGRRHALRVEAASRYFERAHARVADAFCKPRRCRGGSPGTLGWHSGPGRARHRD